MHRLTSSTLSNEDDLPSFTRYRQLKQYKLTKKIEIANENYAYGKIGALESTCK
jgi:hypothetical protein